MTEDQSSNGSGPRSWVDRIGKALSNLPRNREELIELLEESLTAGVIDEDALAMMKGALEVSEMQVRDAMIPRSQMVVVPSDVDLESFLPRIIDSGHSRFPVIGEDKDGVVGILLAKDLLPHVASGGEHFDLQSAIRPAMLIPESKRLNMLLRDFRASRNHMAIVVDEYGGVSGLITIEDVLEEIVGDIDDEYDAQEEALVLSLGPRRYQVQALTPIDDLNEVIGSEFSDDEYGTIGGLLMARFGRVPEVDDVVVLGDRWEFRVTRADSRRLLTLELNDIQ
ncbi:HlyC/CorC family transporter [Elongatibacter sediminis]|uniref:Magnesium and cobalt efflux protein CorC n=1 Tax=Elongatibacter sediminis TaxID=3119006 RepID=A0AAW9REP8_9GAMM